MSRSRHPDIRALLKAEPDGLTPEALADQLGVSDAQPIRNALAAMPDAYIDRWDGPVRGQWVAVWVVVTVPENCPRPDHAPV